MQVTMAQNFYIYPRDLPLVIDGLFVEMRLASYFTHS